MRTTTPRIKPLAEAQWNDQQRKILEPVMQNGQVDNVFATLAQHVEMYDRFRRFGGYIFSRSTLPPREREIVILRMGWLCQAEYEWAQHAVIGKAAGLTDVDIRRIAAGPEAPGWNAFDATLLKAVDELYQDGIVSDDTWAALGKRYDTRQMMDAVLTAGEYTLISMALNTFGVQFDERLKERFPSGDTPPPVAKSGKQVRLASPRVAPLPESEWDAKQRELLEPLARDDGSVLNLYATLIRHPAMFKPRLILGQYLRNDSTLPPRDREIAVLRLAWLTACEYEWGHHARIGKSAGMTPDEIRRVAEGPDASGWSTFEQTLIRAVDQLHTDAWIDDATWSALSDVYSKEQCMDLVFTVGGYKMLAMLINSLGVQPDAGIEGLPSEPLQ